MAMWGEPADSGHSLRRLRRRRGLTQTELGELVGLSCSYISMIERGERTLARMNHITAMAAVLQASPADLAPGAIPGHADLRAAAPSRARTSEFPGVSDEATMACHARLTREFLAHIARRDTLAAGMWLRRTARDPAVSPWLLLDLLATHNAPEPARAARTGGMSGQGQAATAPPGPDHPLRRLRRRRGLTQAELARLAGVSISYISMVERGQRTLTRLDDITAIAAVLRVSPAELAPAAVAAHPDLQPAAAPAPASAFPALRDEATVTRHTRLAREFLAYLDRRDTRAARIWLRRIARDPAVSPWLLLDLVAAHHARTPAAARRPRPADGQSAAQAHRSPRTA